MWIMHFEFERWYVECWLGTWFMDHLYELDNTEALKLVVVPVAGSETAHDFVCFE